MNCPKCARKLNNRDPRIATLSQKQLGIALMVATGRTRTEIAAYTQLNAHNITVQIAIVRDKLGVRNDVELTLFLYGMLDQATTA